MKTQYDRIMSMGNPPESASRYTREPVVEDYKQHLGFSLVMSSAGSSRAMHLGPMVVVPGFGAIHLATVTFQLERKHGDAPPSTTIELTMIEAKLGCLADGTANFASSKTNGSGGGG